MRVKGLFINFFDAHKKYSLFLPSWLFIMDGHDGRVVSTVALQQAYNRLDPHLCLCAFSHAFSYGTKTSIRLTGDSEYAVGMR